MHRLCSFAIVSAYAAIASIASADTIVSWGPATNIVTGNQDLDNNNLTSLNYSSYITPTVGSAYYPSASGKTPEFYGAAVRYYESTGVPGGSTGAAVWRVQHNSSNDRVFLNYNGPTDVTYNEVQSIMMWKKEDFLGSSATASGVRLDSLSVNTADNGSSVNSSVSFVIRLGSNYYISDELGEGVQSIGNPASANWYAYSPQSNYTNTSGSAVSLSASAFENLTEVGVYRFSSTSGRYLQNYLYSFSVTATPLTGTPLTVRDYVAGLPTNDGVGRVSTNPLKNPATQSLPSGASKSGTTINVTGSNVTLEDWNFDGYTVAVKASNCVIRNCVLGEPSGVSGSWTYIDIWTGGHNLLVEHNDILGYAGEGGAGSAINHRTGGSGTGVYAAENITIRLNLLDNMQSDAIKIAGDGALIEWNAFTDPHNLASVPQPWSSSTTYNIGDYALNSGDTIFKSKINNNTYAVPVDKPYNWKSTTTYYLNQPAKNSNGTIFLSKTSGNLNNPIPSTATSNAYWQLYDHWSWYDPHCDHITMLAAPGFLTIQYNYFARPDRSRLVTGMNNALRMSRNTGKDHLVEDVLLHANYLESNTSMSSWPVHINVGGEPNFNGPFTLSHGWYGQKSGGGHVYPLASGVTAYWDTNKDSDTNAAIATPTNFVTQTTTPPSVSVVPSVIINGH